MAAIGNFKKTGDAYVGNIITFAMQARNVRIFPMTEGAEANQPTHRVTVGEAELGVGWSRQSAAGRSYLRLKLDDPSFAAPLFANLVEDESNRFKLVWSRDVV